MLYINVQKKGDILQRRIYRQTSPVGLSGPSLHSLAFFLIVLLVIYASVFIERDEEKSRSESAQPVFCVVFLIIWSFNISSVEISTV